MAQELRDFVEVSQPAAVLHQITSTRTIRAVIVYTLLAVFVFLLLMQREIPELLQSLFALVLGTYFEEFTRSSRSEANSQIRENDNYDLR